MALTRCQVVVPADSALPADVVVNNWAFLMDPTAGAQVTELKGYLKTFYDAWSSNRSVLYVWEQARLKLYDMSAPKPRVPLVDETIGLSASAGTTSLPQEVALCMSFQGVRVSGELQRRRRGRIYLGPFVTNANQGTTGRPDTTFLNQIVSAAQAFLNSTSTSAGIEWVVIHDAGGTPSLGATVHDGWVDNSWDTQRRRGADPSARTVFTLAA